MSFLLGHYTKISEQHNSLLPERNAEHLEEEDWRIREEKLEIKQEQQHLSTSSEQLVGTDFSKESSNLEQKKWPLLSESLVASNTTLEPVKDLEKLTTEITNSDQNILGSKQWNSETNVSQPNAETISLLSNGNSLSTVENYSLLLKLEPSTYENKNVSSINLTYFEWGLSKPDLSSESESGNISETISNYYSIQSPDAVGSSLKNNSSSSSYANDLELAFPFSELQKLNFTNPNENWELLNYADSDKLIIENNMEDNEVVKVGRCFDICKSAKHEVLSDVQVSSIVQYPRVEGTHSVLLLFHGCKHSAQDWFVLPEEVPVVCEALRRNFSVVAFSSSDRWSGCWDSFYPALGNRDVIRVYQSLQEWTRKNFAQKDSQQTIQLKLYALGVSSGGSFVSIFSTFVPHISAQAIYISPGSFQFSTLSDSNPYPPTYFVHMSKDTTFGSFANVNKCCDHLSQLGVPCHILSLEPVTITSEFFHKKIPNISLSFSQQLFNQLNRTEWLDSQGYLVKNPSGLEYSDLWQTIDNPTLEKMWKTYQSSIEEILNRAYGVHEMAADHIDQVLDWFLTISQNNASNNKGSNYKYSL